MDTIYKTYERFISAAKKFPRWNNVRRRPTTSVGGALLHSIVEEIGRVEDAIIEYKKDFFIVNYIGKEDKIVDYLYNAQIGIIDDLSNLVVTSVDIKVTDDIKLFYKESGYCYYQNGYLVFKESLPNIEYTYNSYIYSAELEKTHIWNVFDEFAWWAGLERFEDENNKALLIRTINQFKYRPDSSESGIKNVIYNTISGDGYIDKDNDIIIEKPDESNLYKYSSDGEQLYEEISQFNRDIARTKQWDIDYWDNSFRELAYLPHQWDAEVEHYKDGVGYNDSLYVSIVKDLDVKQSTDITINGYKKSEAKIEEYVKKNNITTDIELNLKKYDDTLIPINVQYKIKASTLTQIDPDNCYVDSYKTRKRELGYSIDEVFGATYVDKIKITPRNKLEPDKQYVLKILPAADNFSTMEIEKCILKHDNGSVDLLTPKGSFGYNDKNIFVNKSVLFHADNKGSFTSTNNLDDYRYGGLTLVEPNSEASCTIDVTGIAEKKSQSLTVSTSCDLFDITNNPIYITSEGFSLENNKYISESNTTTPSILTIELNCRNLEFNLDKAVTSLSSPYVNIETYIDGKLDMNNCYYNANLGTFKQYKLTQYRLSNVKIVIKRNSATPIAISNIMASQYDVKIVTSDGIDISPNKKESVILPKHTGDYYVTVTINNYGQTVPVLNCIHIGANLNILTSVYTSEIDTTGLVNPEIVIKSNCRTDLYLKEDQNNPVDFSPYNLYTNNTTEYQSIYLDLDSFKSVLYSSPEIKYENGSPYISLKPGESIDSIVIYGDNEQQIGSRTLRDIFNVKNIDKLYINKDIKGFILKSSGSEKLLGLTYDMAASYNSDTIKIWSSKNKDIESCFVSNADKEVEFITDKYSGIFSYVYLYDKNTETNIAYNNQNIVQNVTDGIEIIKNFSPALSSFESKLFIIEQNVTDGKYNFNVLFEDENKFSTTITKKIKITSDDNLFSLDSFNILSKDFTKQFILSNSISLPDTYIINDEEVELGRYILSIASDNMDILYTEIEVTQERDGDGYVVYVEEDGFNKLLYSNIKSIKSVYVNDRLVAPENYSLLQVPGIICWNNDKYTGGVLKITYTYNKPSYLVFKDLSYLYDKIGYKIDAYRKVKTLDDEYKIKSLAEGSNIKINYDYFEERPEKISIVCSNPCYTANLSEDNKTITIKKIAEDNSVVIHNGYYYIDGNEYYYFADQQKFNGSRLNGISTKNVETINANMLLKKEAVNYLKNSRMLCNTLNVHCISDFSNDKIDPGIDSLEELGLVNNFIGWYSYATDIKLTDYGINFAARNTNSYSLLDITKALFKNKILACKYDGSLSFSIVKEKFIDDQAISKSLNVEYFDDMNKSGSGIVYYNFAGTPPESSRYFLMVAGNGTLIDLAVIEDTDFNSCFNSNLDRLGIDIQEEVEPETEISVDFSPTAMIFNNTELSKNLELRTATTVDWGVTRIADIDLSKVNKEGFLYRYDSLISQKDDAKIITQPILINSKSSVQKIYVKINDIAYKNLAGFDLKILGSDIPDSGYSEIYSKSNNNLFTFNSNSIPKYVKLEITAKESKIINHLEVFVLYKEGTSSPNVINLDNGYCQTKIYDLGIVGKYVLKHILQDANYPGQIKFQVRGLKVSDTDNVWTQWYNLEDSHIFDGYRYFQFKISVLGSGTITRIESFVFEVKE